jgi:hypothetical protein
MLYENLIGLINDRKVLDFFPAFRFFLKLFATKAPRSDKQGSYLLAGDKIKEYQFPAKLDSNSLAVEIIESVELFGSYHPGRGMSVYDLMFTIDVDDKSLLRAVNRLIDRGIVERTSDIAWGERYVIADYDKADKFLEKHRRDARLKDNREGTDKVSKRKVTYTIRGFHNETTPGQDGVSYRLVYEAVDSALIGTPEEAMSSKLSIIGISGSRTLQSIWNISSGNYEKVLFEVAKRKVESNIREGIFEPESIILTSQNAPNEPLYNPDMISIELNKPIEIEIEAFRAVHAISMKWDAFICHASEDKEAFVRPLAEALQQKDLEVWYDEFTLLVGDSLRRKIDEGLARSRFGVVILSPSFFEKEWPQKELDGLYQKEVEGEKVILPVWHNVNADDVRKYSVTLADKVGVPTTKGLDFVVKELLKTIGNV